MATHYPIIDKARYYERLYPKRSYVLAVRLEEGVSRGMYYNPEEPYFSVRPSPTGDASIALIGGQNHRTGHGGSADNRYRELKQEASRSDFCDHNVHDVGHYLEDYRNHIQEGSVQSIDSGEGKVLRVDDEPVAVSRNEDGSLHAVSAVCTHMGCLVHWNGDEGSWDCPCHGSRFNCDGDVLNTPAKNDLSEYDLE